MKPCKQAPPVHHPLHPALSPMGTAIQALADQMIDSTKQVLNASDFSGIGREVDCDHISLAFFSCSSVIPANACTYEEPWGPISASLSRIPWLTPRSARTATNAAAQTAAADVNSAAVQNITETYLGMQETVSGVLESQMNMFEEFNAFWSRFKPFNRA